MKLTKKLLSGKFEVGLSFGEENIAKFETVVWTNIEQKRKEIIRGKLIKEIRVHDSFCATKEPKVKRKKRKEIVFVFPRTCGKRE